MSYETSAAESLKGFVYPISNEERARTKITFHMVGGGEITCPSAASMIIDSDEDLISWVSEKATHVVVGSMITHYSVETENKSPRRLRIERSAPF